VSASAAAPSRTGPPPLELAPPLRGTPVEVTTPEGVPLVFYVAPASDRVIAVLLDLAFLYVAVLVLALVSSLSFGGGPVLHAVVVLSVFLLRYGYFTAFELSGRGATPGKRVIGIRVVDARGGPLRADAVIVRNLLRELETFVPLIALVFPATVDAPVSVGVWIGASVWAFAFLFVPFCSRRRLRVGDLVAGTMVVTLQRTALLADVARRKADAPVRHAFTDEQLDVYGERELHLLEEVLRRSNELGPGDDGPLLVASKIAKKIGVDAPRERKAAGRFLREYYAALRERLERRLLLGRRKPDKFAK